jgi:hypothetical protein
LSCISVDILYGKFFFSPPAPPKPHRTDSIGETE